MNKNMISRWFSMYVLMMMFGIMGATAQSLSIADFAIRAGESKTITMNLAQGGQTVYGVQTDLTLPEGLTIEGEPAIVEGAITMVLSARTCSHLALCVSSSCLIMAMLSLLRLRASSQ
jgi:hypothetical protein